MEVHNRLRFQRLATSIRQGKSADALLKFLDNVHEVMNIYKVLLAQFIDFFKALDSADHEIIVQKLGFFGFIGKLSALALLFFQNTILNLLKQAINIGDPHVLFSTYYFSFLIQTTFKNPSLYNFSSNHFR